MLLNKLKDSKDKFQVLLLKIIWKSKEINKTTRIPSKELLYVTKNFADILLLKIGNITKLNA
jgi:hypothetical protein